MLIKSALEDADILFKRHGICKKKTRSNDNSNIILKKELQRNCNFSTN